jgi:uncharacterized repeat protein (TIGR01451 family)
MIPMKPDFLRRRAAILLAFLTMAMAPLAHAALGVDIVTSEPTPLAGSSAFSWTITVSNGVGGVTNLRLTDALPNGARFQNVSVSGTAAGYFDCQGPGNNQPGTVTCHAFSMPGSSTAIVTVVAQYTADMAGGVRSNSVRVVSGGTQVTDSVQQTVQNDASVTSVVSEQRDGSYYVRLYSVLNSGHSSALDEMISGSLPPRATFLSAQGTGDFAGRCVYDPNSSGLTCVAPQLRSGFSYITVFYADFDSIFADGFE